MCDDGKKDDPKPPEKPKEAEIKKTPETKTKLPDLKKLPAFQNLDFKKLPIIKDLDVKKIQAQLLKMFNDQLDNLKKMESGDLKNMGDKVMGPPGNPMKFPYTFSAKIAQFPLKFYFQKQWIWRYYGIAILASLPVFYSINKLANSPANVAKWAEIRRKEAAEHHH